MDKLNNIIYYAVICGILILVFLFYKSAALTIIITIMLIIPLLSIGMGYIGYKHLKININTEKEIIGLNEEGKFYIDIKNPAVLPIMTVKIKAEADNCFFRERVERNINFSVGGFKERLILPIKSDCYGKIELGIHEIKINDLLNFVSFKRKINEENYIYILPEKKDGKEKIKEEEKENDGAEKNERIGEENEIFNIREYIEGDKLQKIHWKISSRFDEIMVKENSSSEDKSIVVLFELYNSKREINRVFERVREVCDELLKDEKDFYLCWNDEGRGLKRIYIEDDEDFENTMKEAAGSEASEYSARGYEKYEQSGLGGNVIYIGANGEENEE